jgi:hypothetical protein
MRGRIEVVRLHSFSRCDPASFWGVGRDQCASALLAADPFTGNLHRAARRKPQAVSRSTTPPLPSLLSQSSAHASLQE